MNPRNNSHNQERESAQAIGTGMQPEHLDTDSATAVEEPTANGAPAALPRAQRGFQASFYHTGFNAPVAYESAILHMPTRLPDDRRDTDSHHDHRPSRSRQQFNLIVDSVIPSMKTD